MAPSNNYDNGITRIHLPMTEREAFKYERIMQKEYPFTRRKWTNVKTGKEVIIGVNP